MEPSKPNEPKVDRGMPIPRSRQEEVLEGEVIPKAVPLGGARVPPQVPKPPVMGKRRIGRTLVLVVVGVAAFVCLGGLLMGYLLYDKATQPDRSTPEGVVESYLAAKFASRDDVRARLFQCPTANLGAIDQALAGVKQIEARFNITVTVKPAHFEVTTNGDKATIQAILDVVIPEQNDNPSISEQSWVFDLVKKNAWLLCDAQKVT